MIRSSRLTLLPISTAVLLALAGCSSGGGGGPAGNSPVVNAGADMEVTESDTVTLRGAATDTDGTIVSYRWTQISGPAVVLTGADTAEATFVAGSATASPMLEFRLAATDDVGLTSVDDVAVTVRGVVEGGGLVFFSADAIVDNQQEMFAVDTRGVGAPTMISGGTQHGSDSDVTAFAASPDRQFVAYVADERQDGLYELFIANADGSGSTLTQMLASNSEEVFTGSLRWSPVPINGVYVLAYVAELASGSRELYTVVPGSTPVKVSGPMASSNSDVNTDIAWAPDASRLAYVADADQNNVAELYTTRNDSAANAVKVSSALVTNGDVGRFEWSPRSDKVAYMADQRADNRVELFVAGATTTGGVLVSQSLSGDRDVRSFSWSPDAAASDLRIAYVADVTDTVNELWSTTEDGTDGQGGGSGSGIERESDTMVTNGDVSTSGFKWSPDGLSIAYLADERTDGEIELFVAAAGPDANSTRVSGNLTSQGDVVPNYVWSSDSTRIAYVADQDSDQVFELYVSTADGRTNERVSGAMASGGDVQTSEGEVRWSPDDSRIAYRADQNTNGADQLFTSTPDGFANNTVVSGRPVPGGEVLSGFRWSNDSRRLIYRSDQDENDVQELFTTGIDAEPQTRQQNPKISGTLITNSGGATVGDVFIYEVDAGLQTN